MSAPCIQCEHASLPIPLLPSHSPLSFPFHTPSPTPPNPSPKPSPNPTPSIPSPSLFPFPFPPSHFSSNLPPLSRGIPFPLPPTPYTLLYRPHPFGDTQLLLPPRDIETTTSLASTQIAQYRTRYGDDQHFSRSASGPLGGVFRYPSSNVQVVFRVGGGPGLEGEEEGDGGGGGGEGEGEEDGEEEVDGGMTFYVAAKTVSGIRAAAVSRGFVEEAWILVLEKMGGRSRVVGWVDLRVLEGVGVD